MEADIEQKIKQLELLHDASQWLNDPTLSLSETLEIIRDKSLELVGGRTGCCCLVNPQTRNLSHLVKCHLHDQADHCGIEIEKGIIASVAESGKMMYIPDTKDHERYKPAFSWVRSKITLPLKHGNRILGILNIDSDRPNAFDTHIQLLRTLAGQAAIALENAFLRDQATDKLRKRLQELGAFYKVTNACTNMNIDKALDTLLDEAISLLGGDYGSIRLFDAKERVLYYTNIRPQLATRASDDRNIKGTKFGLDNSRGGWVFKEQKPHFCNDMKSDPLDKCRDWHNANSHVIVPITYQNDKLGVLTIDTARKDAFDNRSARLLLGFGDVAATGICSSRIQERAQAYKKVFSLAQYVASTLKLKDVLEAIVEGTCNELSGEACSIFLCLDTDHLVLQATTSHLLMGLVDKASYEFGEGLTGTVAQREETIIVSDFHKESNWKNKYSELPLEHATTWIGAPILKNGRIAGVIRLTNKIPTIRSSSTVFTRDDANLLEMICAYIAAWGRGTKMSEK